MNLLEGVVQTPAAAALGWTLVHSLWEGAVVASALGVALLFLRSSRARYLAACLAMFGLLAAMAVTFARVLPRDGLDRFAAPGWRALLPQTVFDVQPIAITAQSGLALWLPWLAPFWVAGVLVFYVRSMTGWMAVRRLRRTGICIAPDAWQGRVRALSASLRLVRPVVLLESCLAAVPVTVGYLRPVILIPVGLLTGLPPDQVEAILLHELAHIRRNDYLANLLQILGEGLLFYHPAAWWISAAVRREREHCCDDAVVAVRGSALEYASALAALEQTRGYPREALASTGGSLVKRIRRLLTQPERQPVAAFPLIAAAILIITGVTAVAAWPSRPVPAPPAPAPPVPQQRVERENKLRQELATPYRKWAEEDVVYLLHAEEKDAFGRLTADAERERFIEQFWQRRDPTPATVENEFKEEHYRRIAYANERFAAGVPGWRTDRGRVYIIYGPPDEIQSTQRSAGQESTTISERWRYRFLEGIGRDLVVSFLYSEKSGDYHITGSALP